MSFAETRSGSYNRSYVLTTMLDDGLVEALVMIMRRAGGGCDTYVDMYNGKPCNTTCLNTGRVHDGKFGIETTCDACLAADALGVPERADRRRLIQWMAEVWPL